MSRDTTGGRTEEHREASAQDAVFHAAFFFFTRVLLGEILKYGDIAASHGLNAMMLAYMFGGLSFWNGPIPGLKN